MSERRLSVLRIYHAAVVTPYRMRETELSRRNLDVRLISPRRANGGGHDVDLRVREGESVDAVRMVGRHPFRFFYEPVGLFRALWSASASLDVLDIQEEPASIAAFETYVLARLAGVRAPFLLFSAQNIMKRYPVPFRWTERFLLRRAAAIHTCNDEAGEVLRGKGFSGRVVNLGLGVDLDTFTCPSGGSTPQMNLDELHVGYVGRLTNQKGVHVLLRAVAKEPAVRLVIVGDGPERAEYETLANTLGLANRVTFRGFVDNDDLPNLYRSFDVLVQPSLDTPGIIEQFGRVVGEAQAVGTAVVVSDSGSLPWVAGEPGVVVPQGDAVALGAALSALHMDRADLAARRAAGPASAARFSWRAIAEAQDSLYRQIVADEVRPVDDRPKAPIEVVYVDHCAQLSGGELALSRLLTGLEGVHATVILGEQGPLQQLLVEGGIDVELLELDRSLVDTRRKDVTARGLSARALVASAKGVWQIRARLRELRPDLVHTNSLKSFLLAGTAARLVGIPVVWHVRDRISNDYLSRSGVYLVRFAARVLATSVIAQTHTTASTLGHSASASIVASPISNELFEQPTVASQVASRPTDRPIRFAMVGRLTSWKGQDVFIDAFATAFPDGDEVATIVGSSMFGEYEYEDALREKVASMGLADRIEFTGFVDDIPGVLRECDVLVHASVLPEPFGQVVVEGMATGLAVVASNEGGPSEVITHDVDGQLCPPGDVDALAKVLRSLAGDPDLRVRLGAAGRVRAADFRPEVIGEQVLGVYRRTLA